MIDTTLPIHPVTGLMAVGWRKARDGEDEDQPIWPILGGAPDDDGEDGDGESDSEGESGEDDGADDEADDDGDGDGDSDDEDKPLGPKGEKALRAMKDKLRAEREKRRAAEGKLRKGAEKKDDEQDLESVRRQAEEAATAKANARIVRSEIRAAAAGKLADPKDALTFLDLDQFEVDENGEVDSDEVADAISDLLEKKPYLAAATAKRFQGTGDGGAARKAGKPKQLKESDLKTMTPEQIVKAQNDGRLADLLGG